MKIFYKSYIIDMYKYNKFLDFDIVVVLYFSLHLRNLSKGIKCISQDV